MTSLPIHRLILFFLLGFSALVATAQDRQISVDAPKSPLSLKEEMVYSVTIKSPSSQFNGIISSFPNFEGFTKGIQKISHSRSVENGKVFYVDVVRQIYLPQKEGKYKLSGFQVVIDKQTFSVESKEVQIISSPLDRLSFQRVPELTKEQTKSAFLSMSVSKKEIFVGEGVLVDISFFVPEISQTDWEFPKNIAEQVEAIAQKVKPLDCLENRIIITDIKGEPTQIQGSKFTKYQLFLSWYYPLNSKRISFPRISFSPQRKLKNERIFSAFQLSSVPQVVEVKDLPEHPLKGKVVVGVFQLSELIQKNPVEIGKPFRYIVEIEGVGNLTLGAPILPNKNEKFDFYSENAAKSTPPSFPRSKKEYAFQMTPKELGVISLGDYIRFYYFNSQTQQYDTLKSKINLQVVGDSTGLTSLKTRSTDIFDGLGDIETPDTFLDRRSIFLQLANGLLICMLIATGLLFYTKNNK